MKLQLTILAALIASGLQTDAFQHAAGTFSWPNRAAMALSLSFDDGRASQVEPAALDLFRRHKARVTFFVVPSAVEGALDGWKRAVADGHEIGNHSLTHPCSANFPWARSRALEDYTLDRMRAELTEANGRITSLLGVRPRTFAYPCGQTYVGRGTATRSYVPLVAELFLAGRGWLDEAPTDPVHGDLAQVLGVEMDGRTLPELQPLLDDARARGAWLVLAGHDIGEGGRQTTTLAMLEDLLTMVDRSEGAIWLAPIGEVAEYVEGR